MKNNMPLFIGTKIIKACRMTRQEYNDYRGWELPSDENGDDEGFLVEYVDGGDSNHPDHKGYISWSPKAVFENSYQGVYSGMSFGHAMEMLKAGHKVARFGWNGKGMYIVLVSNENYAVNHQVMGTFLDFLPWLGMKTADGSFVPWLASQTDMLADDWKIVLQG